MVKNWKEEYKEHAKELMQTPEFKNEYKIQRLKTKMFQGYELKEKEIEFLKKNNIKILGACKL